MANTRLQDIIKALGLDPNKVGTSEQQAAEDALNRAINQASSSSSSSSSSSNSSSGSGLSGTLRQLSAAVKSLDNANSSTVTWNQNILDLGSTITDVFNSKSITDFFGKILAIAEPFMELDQALRNQVNVGLGITGGLARDIRTNIIEAAEETTKYGIEVGDIADLYAGFIGELGKAVPLNKELLEDTAKAARASGVTMREASQFMGSLESLGINLIKGPKILKEMADTARSMGLNTSAFMGYATENLKLINTLGFEKGVRGFTEIAAKAASIRFDLNTAATKANELFEVDNAIELAAQLNVLGGEFGRLGNAIDLMFMPTNDFEGFTEAIMEAQKQFVSFNEETQSFEPTPLDLRRAREFAKAMGKDVNTVIEEAKSAARRDLIKDRISIIPGMDDKDRELIASLGQINENGEVTIKGKTITEMSSKELQTELGRLRQEGRKGAMSTEEILNEQMNIGTKTNFYLKAIALQMGALGKNGGMFTLLGDDLNDLIYSLTDGDPKKDEEIMNILRGEGIYGLDQSTMTEEQLGLFDKISQGMSEMNVKAMELLAPYSKNTNEGINRFEQVNANTNNNNVNTNTNVSVYLNGQQAAAMTANERGIQKMNNQQYRGWIFETEVEQDNFIGPRRPESYA